MKNAFRKNARKLVAAGVAVAGTMASAAGNITVPNPNYDDIYALAGVAIGIAVVVMLVKKGKSLFA
jgi:hypothetical protein